jgi:hypothetical protein
MPQEQQVVPCERSILCECLPQVNLLYLLWCNCIIDILYRMNVKLGGINTIPDHRSVSILTDPQNPTIVMGVSEMQLSICLYY